MANANRNQGVFIPYHQLVDLRSLNHPHVTFVPGPPIGLINPRNGLVGPPQFVPIGVTFNRSFHELLIRMEKEKSPSLLQFMAGEGLVPSPEEEIKRKHAIEKLKQVVMEWIKRVACDRGLDECRITAASAAVLIYGSYGLSVIFCFPLVSYF